MTPRRRPPVPVLLAAQCLLMAVLVATLAQRQEHARDVDTARRDALAVAPRIARDVLSYDYRTIDADIARAKRDCTGAFEGEYLAYAGRLESAAIADRAIVQAQPHAPGVVTADGDTAIVLVFVDQVSVRQPSGAATPATRVEQSRVQMTLRKVGGSWLLAGLKAL